MGEVTCVPLRDRVSWAMSAKINDLRLVHRRNSTAAGPYYYIEIYRGILDDGSEWWDMRYRFDTLEIISKVVSLLSKELVKT